MLPILWAKVGRGKGGTVLSVHGLGRYYSVPQKQPICTTGGADVSASEHRPAGMETLAAVMGSDAESCF